MTLSGQEASPIDSTKELPFDMADALGRTPAAVAASAGDAEVFMALLLGGADVTTVDIMGNGPAHYLGAWGLFNELRAMREAGHGAHIDTARNFQDKTPQAIADAHFKSIAPTHEVPGTPFAPSVMHYTRLQQDLESRPVKPAVGPAPRASGPST